MTKEEKLDWLCRLRSEVRICLNFPIDWRKKFEEALSDVIDGLLRSDAVPMAHGRWIHCEETDRFYEHWGCSICGHDVRENPSFKNLITGEQLDFLFCPYCGARMDGKDGKDGKDE